MKVLIGNFHNNKYGGGELYTYQVAKAISQFADIYFVAEPNKGFMFENPDLVLKSKIWNGTDEVDTYININHFQALICNKAKTNIGVVLFPNKKQKVSEYDHLVSICDYSSKYVTEYWGRNALVCSPYSKSIEPGVKVPKTIVSVGNFFEEKDGHSKNQHLLIEAFKQLGEGWKLTLVGGIVHQPYVNKLKQAAVGLNVEIIPNIAEVMKDHLLQTSEFFWHANGYGRIDPYQTEHFGIAPEEAIKAGCLTYVHNSGGAKDFARSWNSISELVSMTLNRAENNDGCDFQSKIGMERFWRDLLC